MSKQEVFDYLSSLEETKIEVVKTLLYNNNDFDFLEKLTENELWKILLLSNCCMLMGFGSYEEK